MPTNPTTLQDRPQHSKGTGFNPIFTREERLDAATRALLDAVDYTAGACSPTEMVGAVLPKELIEILKHILNHK